eukprot:scaffold34602_cov40-Cyclotella_meneghiniana.AAC.3
MDRERTQNCALPCTALSVVTIPKTAEACFDKYKPIGELSGGRLHKCEGETPESCVYSKRGLWVMNSNLNLAKPFIILMVRELKG